MMVLSPHPSTSDFLIDKDELSSDVDMDEVSQNWQLWFRQVKDNVNLGQTPELLQEVTASGGVKLESEATNIIIRIQSATAGAVDITANPQIEAGFDGQVITIEGEDDTKTVQLDDGDGLKLAGAASFVLGEYDVITLHYNGNKKIWIENNRSDN